MQVLEDTGKDRRVRQQRKQCAMAQPVHLRRNHAKTTRTEDVLVSKNK